MDRNSNRSSYQNLNFYDSQNQSYSFIPPNFQFTQNSQNPYFPPFMQNFSYPYFFQNMQINSHNLDISSRTHNSKLTETHSVSSCQIPSFSTEPEIENINLAQESNEEVGDKHQP